MPLIQRGADDRYLGSPGGVIATAQEQISVTNAYVLQLGTLAASLAPPTIEPVFPTGTVAPALVVSTPPTPTTVIWTAPDAPAAFTATLDVGDFLPEPFDDDPPALAFGTAPTAFTDTIPDAPPIDLEFTYPELSVTLPAPPDLLSLNVVPFDGITMPTIDFTIPELTAVAPTIREYVPGAQYTSALLTSLQTKLTDWVTNGGTGIAPAVENAIWDRGREREVRAAAEALLDLERMETLGYAFPSGVYLDARVKIITETDYASRGHSREVMIKQAELEQENIRTALTTATQLEGNLLNYSNQVEQRLFDSCRYATEAGISIYNAQVQAYSAYVEAYSKKVNIYEALVRGELARVEAYKAQISAEQAKAQINVALVEQYKVQADVALSNIEIFKAQIGVIQSRASIEKMKIETYGEQVRAYSARIGAYTAGVEGFRATIQAEASKQDAFRSQVEAYRARVESGVKQIEARIDEFKARTDVYVAQNEAYKSTVQAEAARVQALASIDGSRAETYKAEVQGLASYNEVLTKQWQVSLDQAQRTAEIGISAAKANAELYVTTRSVALDAAKVGAQVSAQISAAALNAINWSSSINNSYGESNSYSSSDSTSVSTATSTSHNYNYSV